MWWGVAGWLVMGVAVRGGLWGVRRGVAGWGVARCCVAG